MECPQCGKEFDPYTGVTPKKNCSPECNRITIAAQRKAWAKRNPKWARYCSQKSNATRRGIDFHFTFEDWVDWWGEDFSRRGKGTHDLCMARINDNGPYEPSNVVKATTAQNNLNQV